MGKRQRTRSAANPRDMALRSSACCERCSAARLLGAGFVNREATRDPPAPIRTGASFVIPEITDEIIARFVEPDFREDFARLGLRGACIVPIRGEHARIGSVWIASADLKKYAETDIPTLEEIGIRAAPAIRNARLYERERRLALVLQAAQLPERLPTIPGVRLNAKYVAGVTKRQLAVIGMTPSSSPMAGWSHNR
jgi:GAF domain-containing protein